MFEPTHSTLRAKRKGSVWSSWWGNFLENFQSGASWVSQEWALIWWKIRYLRSVCFVSFVEFLCRQGQSSSAEREKERRLTLETQRWYHEAAVKQTSQRTADTFHLFMKKRVWNWLYTQSDKERKSASPPPPTPPSHRYHNSNNRWTQHLKSQHPIDTSVFPFKFSGRSNQRRECNPSLSPSPSAQRRTAGTRREVDF